MTLIPRSPRLIRWKRKNSRQKRLVYGKILWPKKFAIYDLSADKCWEFTHTNCRQAFTCVRCYGLSYDPLNHVLRAKTVMRNLFNREKHAHLSTSCFLPQDKGRIINKQKKKGIRLWYRYLSGFFLFFFLCKMSILKMALETIRNKCSNIWTVIRHR